MCFDIGEQTFEFASSCFGTNSEFGILKDIVTLPQSVACIKNSKSDVYEPHGCRYLPIISRAFQSSHPGNSGRQIACRLKANPRSFNVRSP
jgi:hypothetical protein